MSVTERLLDDMSDDDMETAIDLTSKSNEPIDDLTIVNQRRREIDKDTVRRNCDRTSKKDVICACFNTLNHMIIGTVTVYFTYFSFVKHDWTTHGVQHAFMTVFGYQLLMAEAIMSLYSGNSWTQAATRDTKKTIHWVMQVIGSALAIAGISLRISHKDKDHFKSPHAITGLISMIFLIITCCNGVGALWSRELRTYVKPIYSKLIHNCTAIGAFVVGMVSLNYGYDTKYMQRRAESDQRLWLQIAAIITTVLSLPGALLTIYDQVKTIFFSS